MLKCNIKNYMLSSYEFMPYSLFVFFDLGVPFTILTWIMGVRVKKSCSIIVGLLLAGCAGRAPQPIATVQPQDVSASCAMITAEIEANNIKVKELADEQGIKVAQNVAAGVAGLVVWPMLFAMDWQGSAGKDVAALQARQQFLTNLALDRCKPETPAKQAPKK